MGKGRRDAGGALVITLAFVLLTTIAILAYFVHTQSALLTARSSVTLQQNDNLVTTALEATVSDLRMEMLAGAEADTNRTNYSALDPLIVRRRWAMVPARVVSTNLPSSGFENLVKQSLSGAAFYPGAAAASNYVANGPANATGNQRASTVNSTVPAANGRILSAARWDQVALAAKSFPSNALPDWIYVTREGVPTSAASISAASAGSSNAVTGRYAYQIYDVGGALDLNVAGQPSTFATNAATKGGLAWADLTALGLSTDQIDSLMEFRHRATKSHSDWPDRIRYQAEKQGFTEPLKEGAASDGFFYTRQDLLRFFLNLFGRQKIVACTDAERATLASITQDLRFLTAPSWNPPTLGSADRPAIKPLAQGGNNSQGLDDLFNPVIVTNSVLPGKEFSRLRFQDTKAFTNPEEVAAKVGEPFVLDRFPLNRLKLLARNAVAEKDSPIHRYFGLTRSSPDEPWVYNHGTSSPLRILRLTETRNGVNTDDNKAREPDFLELLKVAITAGSLGKSAGIYNGGTSWANERDQRVNYQLVQIFANLIDQFDADGFPTHIQFDGMSFYGVENLPYLFRIKKFMARLMADSDTALDTNGKPLKGQPFSIVWLPEVWNPHDSTQALPADRPVNFRIAADTLGVAFPMQYRDSANNTDQYYQDGSAEFDPERHYIELTANAMSKVYEPLTINRTALGTPSVPLPTINRKPPAGSNFPDWSTRAAVDTDLAGIPTPAIFVDLDVPKIGLRFYTNGDDDTSLTPPALSFSMEYQDPATGEWHPYFERPLLRAGADGGTDSPRGKSKLQSDYDQQNNTRLLTFDPRTDRFSSYRIQERDSDSNAYKDNDSLRPNQTAGHGLGYNQTADNRQSPARDTAYGWTVGAASLTSKNTSGSGTLGLAMGTILQNSASSVTRYTDPDGVLRSGDGVLASGSDKEGQMYWPGNAPSRPIILNRPFSSVAEMGYAFRDTPGRSLDFFTAKSGDAVLLDFFCIDETPDDGITSGRVSANSRNPKVVESLLRGALRDPVSGSVLSSARASDAAQALVSLTTDAARGPLINRTELATRFLATLPLPTDATERIKRQREVFVRALADSMETRTWNLLIDLIAQTGRIPMGKDSLGDFRVESERHVWAHLAIDRVTGKVIHLNIESVNE